MKVENSAERAVAVSSIRNASTAISADVARCAERIDSARPTNASISASVRRPRPYVLPCRTRRFGDRLDGGVVGEATLDDRLVCGFVGTAPLDDRDRPSDERHDQGQPGAGEKDAKPPG